MQVKIIVGTVAFMLTMIVLGFVALREPARMEAYTKALYGRSAENGAETFNSACSTCHGVNGKAEECFDAGGNKIVCIGLPLNNASLLCTDAPPRLETMRWAGTKQQFIQATIYSGRPGTAMPTWSQDLGGPLQQNQVEDLTTFILNWESEELCAAPPPPKVEWPASVTEMPTGDPAAGATLFTSYGCVGCHGDASVAGGNTIAPDLYAIWQTAGDKIEGYSAADYIYESIVDPDLFVADGCPAGACPPGLMSASNFSQRLSQQEMSDLVQYLLQER